MNKAKESPVEREEDVSSLSIDPQKNPDAIIDESAKSGQSCQVLMFLSKRITEIAAPAEIISADTTCMDVMALLEKYSSLLVSKKYEVIGVITDMSLVKNIMKKDLEKLTAEDLLQDIETIDSSKNVRQAIIYMDEKNATVLAVTSKSAILGTITALDLRKFLAKRSKSEIYPQEDVIETKIDEFIALIRRGPIAIKDAEKFLGVKQEQIESWIEVLENQNIMKIEKRMGKLVIKNDRKV